MQKSLNLCKSMQKLDKDEIIIKYTILDEKHSKLIKLLQKHDFIL